MELAAGKNDNGRRIDRILRKALPGYPLSFIHRLLRQKKILVNGKPAKADDRISEGDVITVPASCVVSHNDAEEAASNAYLRYDTELNRMRKKDTAQKAFDIEILWQSDYLIAFNKPAGLAAHGKNSLEEKARDYLSGRLPPSLSFKIGPLHRLDKPSSGIVVFPLSLEGARLFSSLMRDRKIKKTYLAIVEGKIEKETIWEDSLARDKRRKKTFVSKTASEKSKGAVTKVKPLSAAFVRDKFYSFISAEIITGRTHQIRAQAAFHGHPLAGDRKYGSMAEDYCGFLLHAWKLEFPGALIKAPLPESFINKLALF